MSHKKNEKWLFYNKTQGQGGGLLTLPYERPWLYVVKKENIKNNDTGKSRYAFSIWKKMGILMEKNKNKNGFFPKELFEFPMTVVLVS